MGRKILSYTGLILILYLIIGCDGTKSYEMGSPQPGNYSNGKPWTRWWWHASIFTKADIRNQLVWLKDNNFGGVEVAFIYPVNRNPEGERFEWLGEEWQKMVVYAKQCADSLGLGCDFTFGTLWPFGGTFVNDEDRTQIFGDSLFKQPLRLSWTHPDTGNVINHLSKPAFDRYAKVMGEALAPAMKGSVSALFCDSWEVETRQIWTDGFEKDFQERYGYDIIPYMKEIYAPDNAGPRYDYMKLVSEKVINGFYIPFHEKCREMGGISRVQCAGSPTDLITAYSVMDVPESEAMLYNPNFSAIVASAAALSNKPLVSAESFTCLYGWPAAHIRKEQTADLKMVADALFANGVNLPVWHGTPFNPVGVDTIYFYASVHVGTRGSLAPDLASFNDYLARVSEEMRFGRTYSDIAVYLPLEDHWIAGELPTELQLPWAWGEYELRYEYIPEVLAGYRPLWVNTYFLEQAKIKDNVMDINGQTFKALYVDAQYLDLKTLKAIHRLAGIGFPVYLLRDPVQAGLSSDPDFEGLVSRIRDLPNVYRTFPGTPEMSRLVEGEDIPEFWCRTDGKSLSIFFANPLSKNLKYPLEYGQAYQDSVIIRKLILNHQAKPIPVELKFEPNQSVLIRVDEKGKVEFPDITYRCRIPVKSPGL